jgi:hypothetical protein
VRSIEIRKRNAMARKKALFAVECLIISMVILLILIPACRKERPPIDRNRAPETFITSSPTETTETDYRVHMYWHGTDEDGVVSRYIWYISDTLLTLDPEHNPSQELLDWNPAERIGDYLKGRFTARTDTVIIFKGFDDRTGALVNRQAFHIAAIDDGGKIDPMPARLQFNARVKGIPKVQFWTDIYGTDEPYNPNALDTISMFKSFAVKFMATTVNNVITGYRWSYGGKVFPDYNNDGNPDWLIPEHPTDTVGVTMSNSGSETLPSGTFNFKVIARDEAGALSRSDIVSGEGVCRVVVNHDPDTRILRGMCFFVPQGTGLLDSMTVNFAGGLRDTLPYGSKLRFEYAGWDDKRDSLQFNPPLPIRFQFAYKRWAIDQYNSIVAEKTSPWYPLKYPEDTNPSDPNDLTRDTDSTTFRVGPFNYQFFARSFDEQNRPDGTPAVVSFVGNFKPTIDSVRVGFIDQKTYQFRPTRHDTLVIGWGIRSVPYTSRGDTLNPDSIWVDPVTRNVTKRYRFVVRSGGHDDHRDPPGSGIKGWKYWVLHPTADYPYYKEGEWIFKKPLTLNTLQQELSFTITVGWTAARTDSVVNNPPAFFGGQQVRVLGIDIEDTETTKEGVRCVTPEFDATGHVIPCGEDCWCVNNYTLAAYARSDTMTIPVYLKLVM